ncbi:hypothetical protein TSOC_001828 [Tetrabaena socialis]|uniref:Sodium/metabolite cotransporter BASS4, chloroplastic n=1 Tax=Tetrabaena socialis TaxID=47790 RepID=A0A2J8AFW7_9CHLO|nr:hypothetical protein TSOC_001828 [Tetrabaena socialis]|eukprot:PNH11396.1 hypothetical protein TSOC_001828 [Tetrabaena socialis]
MGDKCMRVLPLLWRSLTPASPAAAACTRELSTSTKGLLSSYGVQLFRQAGVKLPHAPNYIKAQAIRRAGGQSEGAASESAAAKQATSPSSSLSSSAPVPSCSSGANPGAPLMPSAAPNAPPPPKSLWKKAKPVVVKNFLPLAFATALVAALAWPDPGRFFVGLTVLDNVRIAQVLPMALVFLITGLQLDTKDMRRALSPRNTPAVLYGLAAILLVTPCLGFLLRELPLEPKEFVGLALGMHVAFLAANYLVVWHLLRTPLQEAIAVIIMASQKSAPVAVTVISYLSNHPPTQGLLALPAVVGQLGQIFIGAALAPHLAQMVVRHNEAQALAKYAQQAHQPQQAGEVGQGSYGQHAPQVPPAPQAPLSGTADKDAR